MPEKHKLYDKRHNDAGLTQRELAEASNISTSTISHIECHRGPDVPRDRLRTTKTKLDTALKLLAALGCVSPGTYTLDAFVEAQAVFTRLEIFEAMKTDRLQNRRQPKGASKRHLRAVA